MNLKNLLLFFILASLSQVLLGQTNTPNAGHDSVTILTFEEKLPVFPGGQKAMFKILEDNLVYPKAALEENVGGKVITKFTIDTFGNVTNIKVVQGVRQDLDNEAVRLIGLLTNWTPATQNGKKVNVIFTLPLNFYPDNRMKRNHKIELYQRK
jgi:TonB family protein